jgi:hypothetical protein
MAYVRKDQAKLKKDEWDAFVAAIDELRRKNAVKPASGSEWHKQYRGGRPSNAGEKLKPSPVFTGPVSDVA